MNMTGADKERDKHQTMMFLPSESMREFGVSPVRLKTDFITDLNAGVGAGEGMLASCNKDKNKYLSHRNRGCMMKSGS